MLAFTSSFATVFTSTYSHVVQRRPIIHRARTHALQATAEQPIKPVKKEPTEIEKQASAPKTAWDLLRVIAASGCVLLGIFIFDAVFGIAAFGIAVFGTITVLFGARRAVRWRTNARKLRKGKPQTNTDAR